MNQHQQLQKLIDKGLLVILSGDTPQEKKRQLDEIQKEIQKIEYKREQA